MGSLPETKTKMLQIECSGTPYEVCNYRLGRYRTRESLRKKAVFGPLDGYDSRDSKSALQTWLESGR